jgi:selenocysteine-specific elongation factor
LVDRILTTYEETGFRSPRPDEVPGILGGDQRDVERLMQHLYDEGRLVRLAKNVALSYTAFKKAESLVVETIQEKGELDSADFKNVIGSTRKYALAILDFLDARRVTVRHGNLRRLAPDYDRNLLQ